MDGDAQAQIEGTPAGEFIDRRIMVRLLNMVGDRKTCDRCGATMWWVKSYQTGRGIPFDASGQRHPMNCPEHGPAAAQGSLLAV